MRAMTTVTSTRTSPFTSAASGLRSVSSLAASRIQTASFQYREKTHRPQSRPSRVASLHGTRGTLDGRRPHHRRILRGRLTHHRALPAQNKRDECVCVCACVPVCVFFEYVYVLTHLCQGMRIRQGERRDLWLVCTDDITHTRRTPFCARRPRASK